MPLLAHGTRQWCILENSQAVRVSRMIPRPLYLQLRSKFENFEHLLPAFLRQNRPLKLLSKWQATLFAGVDFAYRSQKQTIRLIPGTGARFIGASLTSFCFITYFFA